MAKKALYRPTKDDLAIFEASETNPNLFSNFYIRTPYTTGTYFNPPEEVSVKAPTEWMQQRIEERRATIRKNYTTLYTAWESLNRPSYFLKDESATWIACNRTDFERYNDALSLAVYQAKQNRKNKNTPIFFRHHGFLFQPWQLDFALSPHSNITTVGGYGSGKSTVALIRMCIWAATLEGFKGAIIAPYDVQVSKNFADSVAILKKSIFADRFLIKSINRAPRELIIGNDMVGENNIIFLPALDDPEKVKNLEVDAIIVEQAEQFPNILAPDTGLLSMVGSRTRGRDFQSGRERLGKTMWIANSSSNPELWGLVAREKTDPDVYKNFKISTLDNIHISEKQIRDFISKFGQTAEDAEVSMNGGKPLGSGKEFSRAAVELCSSRDLNEYMAMGLANKMAGFSRAEANGVGIHTWMLPPEPNAIYAQFADPGWGNPPYRNSPAIAVFRVDDFPARPAELAAFQWVFGNGQPHNWINTFIDNFHLYNIPADYSAYDATGPQSGYQQLNAPLASIGAVEVSMAGGMKDTYITFLRMMLNKQMIMWPEELMSWTHQLTEYEQPDKNLAQDIVMMLVIAAAWLQPHYRRYVSDLNNPTNALMITQRREHNRHARNIVNRHKRSVVR